MASKAQELHEIEKVGIRERQPRSRQNCEEDLKREAATPPDSPGLTRLQSQIRSTPKDSGFVLLEMVVKDEWTRAMMSLKDLVDHPHGWGGKRAKPKKAKRSSHYIQERPHSHSQRPIPRPEIHGRIYVVPRHPVLCINIVKGKENLFCKLKKSLYGLKQSPRQWYLRFDKFMSGQNYSRSQYDHCVYFKKLQDGSFIYLLIYVDDMLIASKNVEEIEKLKKQMKNEFEMKDLGEAKKILGMEITRDREKGLVSLNQRQYLEKLIRKFGVHDSTKPVSTPLAPHFKLSSLQCSKTDKEKLQMKNIPYANLVGSLMYAMVCSRPDIAHAVGMVSRYMHNPGKEHWHAAKWILRYLHGTRDVGLCFERDDSGIGHFAVGYVDSDYAGDLDGRKSTTGYVFTMAKGPVCWRSILQSSVALSTTEAEYMAVAEAIKEAIWIHGLIRDLGVDQKQVEVHCDSQSAIYLAKYQVHHARTKHIDVRYHFVREIVGEGEIILQKIPTKDNPTDMLTKVVGVAKFVHCLNLAHIMPI
ncbi:hypothetical protein ACFX15_005064 [Malus domestica]